MNLRRKSGGRHDHATTASSSRSPFSAASDEPDRPDDQLDDPLEDNPRKDDMIAIQQVLAARERGVAAIDRGSFAQPLGMKHLGKRSTRSARVARTSVMLPRARSNVSVQAAVRSDRRWTPWHSRE